MNATARTASSGGDGRARVVLICLGVLVALGAAELGSLSRQRDANQEIVETAVDRLYFASHEKMRSISEIKSNLEVWHLRFSRYTSRIAYRAPDRVTVTFWNNGALIGRQDLERYSLGWMPPVPTRSGQDDAPQHPQPGSG